MKDIAHKYIHAYIHTLLYLPSDYRVACAASISEHLNITWEIDHYTGKGFSHSWVSLVIFAKWNSSSLTNCLLLRPAYTFYVTCAVVENGKIILFRQKWCARLNETLESAVRTYMINTFTHPVSWCTCSSVRWALARNAKKWHFESLLVATAEHFISFLLHFFFPFLSKNHLPKGSVCLSVSCIKKKMDIIAHWEQRSCIWQSFQLNS